MTVCSRSGTDELSRRSTHALWAYLLDTKTGLSLLTQRYVHECTKITITCMHVQLIIIPCNGKFCSIRSYFRGSAQFACVCMICVGLHFTGFIFESSADFQILPSPSKLPHYTVLYYSNYTLLSISETQFCTIIMLVPSLPRRETAGMPSPTPKTSQSSCGT